MSNIVAEVFKDEIAEAAEKAAKKIVKKAVKKAVKEAAKEAAEKAKIEGESEGKEKKLIENIRSLMETLNLTAKQAMDALKVPANEQNKYLTLI